MDLLTQLLALPAGDAIFDLDGTLIRGDIGDSTFRRLLGQLPPSVRAVLGSENPWARYEEIVRADFCAAGDLAGKGLAGRTIAEVEALVEEAFATGDVELNTPVVELARALQARHRVWILTGSAEVLGRAVGRRLGIDRVVGLRLRMDGDRFTDELLPPCTCGEGKVQAAKLWISEQPVFAIGDSPTDLPVMRTARVARGLGRIAGKEFPAFS
jgi:HAD superfamily phosphoserine phosphatase-like hydrolase